MIVDELITYLGFETNLSPGKAAKNLMDQITSAGKGLAAGISGAAASIQVFSMGVAESLADNKQFADSLNVSYEALQKYQYALKSAGGSAEDAKSDMAALAEFAHAEGKSIEEVVENLARDMEGAGALQTTRMLEGIGMSDSGIKALREGSESVKRSMQEAVDSGAVVSEKSAENAMAFNKVMADTKSSIVGVFNEAVGGALPEVTRLISLLKQWIKDNQGLIRTRIKEFIDGFSKGFREAVGVLNSVYTAIKPVLEFFVQLGDEKSRVDKIATAIKYLTLALVAITAIKFASWVLFAAKELLSFSHNILSATGLMPLFKRGVIALAAQMKLAGITSLRYWRFMMNSPHLAAQVFASWMKKSIFAIGRFSLSIFTKGIPAVARFTWSLITASVKGLFFFAKAIFTTVIPALFAFTVALLTNPATWIVLGIVAAVAVLVAAIVGLWKWFSVLHEATGSITGSLLVMGQTILKALLMPVNSLINSVVSLLELVSKIPVVGKKFAGLAETIKEYQNKANKTLTGAEDPYDLTSPTRQAIAGARSEIPAEGEKFAGAAETMREYQNKANKMPTGADPFGLTSPTLRAIAGARSVAQTSVNPGGARTINAPNNAKMEQQINIYGATNPQETARKIAERTSTSLDFLTPGPLVPYGEF